jgi:arabinogalactan oligomer/maltooligosaccharide transport system substrate-binding protein
MIRILGLVAALAWLGVAGACDKDPSGGAPPPQAQPAQGVEGGAAAKPAPGQAARTGEAAVPAKAPAAPAQGPAATVAAAAAAATVDVVLWHAYRADEKAALEKVVATYNASQQAIQVRAQAVPYDPFVDKVTITVPRGQGPDLFIFAHNMVGNWVEKGVLEPISGRVPPAVLQSFLPQSVKALVYRKNIYGLPLALKSLVLFYNKGLLDAVPATMEELVAKLKPLQTKTRQGFVYEAGGLYFHAPWIYAFGGAIFDDAHRPAFDTPEQLKALEFVRGLHLTEKVLPKGVQGFALTDMFKRGDAITVLNGPWFRAEIAGGVDYGVATIPSVGGQPAKPLLGVEAVFISKTSTKKDAAIEAALYLAGPESAQVRMSEGKQPVAHAATIEAGAATDPAMKVFLAQAKQAVLMDASPEMQLVWSLADSAISSSVFVADAKPAEELAKAQAKIVANIDKRGK